MNVRVGANFAQLVSDHLLGDIHRNMLLTVVNCDRVSDKFREYQWMLLDQVLSTFFSCFSFMAHNPCVQLCFHIRSLLQASAHDIFPPYLAFLRLTINLSVRAFLFLVL